MDPILNIEKQLNNFNDTRPTEQQVRELRTILMSLVAVVKRIEAEQKATNGRK